jgi:hypothetical protein
MERQARAWTFKRLLVLHTIWKTRFMNVMQSGLPINDTQTTVRIDHYAMLILNSILDLYLEADIRIRARTDGFSFVNGIHKLLIGAITMEKSPKQLNAIFAGMEEKREKDMRAIVDAAAKERKKQYEAATAVPKFMKAPMEVTHHELAHKQLQPEIEAPLALEAEMWVRELGKEGGENFGFVAYRVSYGESEEEWAAFLDKTQEGVERGWEGVIEAANVKGRATLEWVDGRAEGISEGDLEAVRR